MNRRIMALLARHPLPVDAGLAAIVAIVAVLIDWWGPNHRPPASLAWDVLLALPLIARRRLPVAAAATLGVLCLLQWLSGDLASGDLAVLVMLYTLGAWEQRIAVLAAAVVVAEAGVVMAVSRWDPDSRPWLSVLLLSGTVTASWVIGAYTRMRRAYVASMVQRAESAERDRDTQARMAVAAERARLAREMHDIVAHSVSVMITLNDAVVALAPEGSVRDTASQASEVGRQALQEMHRLLGVLRSDGPPDTAPQPGTAQLTDLVALTRSAGLHVDLAVTGDPGMLSRSDELTIFRIVQESLTNVLKHATNVTRVEIDLTYRADRVAVRVHNDGDPTILDSKAVRPLSGHGLTGMRERANLYGGRVEAGPARGGGWTITADLPLTSSVVR